MGKPKETSATSPSSHSLGLLLVTLIIIPISIALVLLNQPIDFNPVKLPSYSFNESVEIPSVHAGILAVSERVGEGLLVGPEDLAYDAESGFIYTGCADGWIRRVHVADGAVEDWARVGGRPLGVALGSGGSLLIAEADKGLLLVKTNKEVELLTDEAEGVKFALTDGVDVASNGLIYFTDASYKYDLHAHLLDMLEGRPHGRLLSFDPSTKRTEVLVRDLYFANGVSISPDHQSLIFCETVLRRCKRYHIDGEKKGLVEIFVDDLPGFPDNIRYDGEGHYWIGLSAGRNPYWDTLLKYPLLRKIAVVLGKFASMSLLEKDAGLLSVNLDGKPVALYTDRDLYLSTGGLKIGKHLYYGPLTKSYISKIDLTKHVAEAQ